MRPLVVLLTFLSLALSTSAHALDGTPITTLDALHEACNSARADGPRTLWVVTVASGRWHFAASPSDGARLVVDTRHNLPILGGAAALMPAFLERLSLPAEGGRAAELSRAASEGASLRIGFFLGMDDRAATMCVLRPAAGVTMVRAEIAYIEVLSAEGEMLAREDTERMRAVRQDEAVAPVTGGARAIVDAPSAEDGSAVPQSWTDALRAAGRGTLAAQLARCHTGHGAVDVVVRLMVGARTGAVRSAEVELAAGAAERESHCVAQTLAAGVALPAGDARAREDHEVPLSVPVRFPATR